METANQYAARYSSLPRLETKYRDIADGNLEARCLHGLNISPLETKYRDIADGNLEARCLHGLNISPLETKYRDIADGNLVCRNVYNKIIFRWKPSTAM